MAKLSAKYEILYIIDPAQGEEGIAALVEKFKGIVENHGTLTSVDEWGKRHLAYPINDLTEGYYVYMTCDVTPDMPAELDRVFKITDGILRSIIVAVEEYYNKRRRERGDIMPISDKKKISNSRYIAKCDSIQIRPPKERGDEIRAAAAAAGQSMQSYILQACAERMTRDGFTPAESGEEGGL